MENAAIRVRVPELEYAFTDRVQGEYRQHLGRDVGDFIIRRRDGLYAYQLAVVLDDAAQGVTDIVRGADLLDYTAPALPARVARPVAAALLARATDRATRWPQTRQILPFACTDARASHTLVTTRLAHAGPTD